MIFAWFGGPRWEVTGVHPLLRLEDRRTMRDAAQGAALVIGISVQWLS